MRLYYMTKLETVEKYILPEWRMKLSTFDKLNDPFELLCGSLGDTLTRRLLKALKDHWTRELGIVCFSPTWKSPLMWAHYADAHTGVCLGIDVLEEEMIREVVYEPERLRDLFDATKPRAGATQATMFKVLTTKYAQWSYEEERRVFANLKDRDPVTGHYYVDFDSKVMLREVIVGARCPRSVGALAKLVKASGKVLKPVTVLKARPAFSTFTMVRQKLVKPITVPPTRR
jgi:Protein of unknown function (DUF2971)